ncbi:MAG: TfoX/Sxy family protein [Solirubrobacteraceae bacterium]|nr:TfoX/Sxy family protein [Solirubrobacteraceae bacterium]
MAYDEDLALRLQVLLADEAGLTTKRMFGGLAFLVGGNMAVAASSKGGIMVRVEPGEHDALLGEPHVSPMIMGGRETRGWLRVSDEGVDSDADLGAWAARGVAYARSLPAK